ncbi:hypothetical protein [Aureivirga marina]|uniref:hypothetical protein n=1 Tax=Aureivirga marina TaxID=1182451 RepID=UPI0018CB1234|nr:hypothetical protein [Aureivirga marina]
MKKITFTNLFLIIALVFITSCSKDDDSSSNNQQPEEPTGTQICDYDVNNIEGSFAWVNDLIDENVVDITFHKESREVENGFIQEHFYVFINKYMNHTIDGETFRFITSIPYDCAGNALNIEMEEFVDFELLNSSLDLNGNKFGRIPITFQKMATLYSNYFDFSTPLEDISWLNDKKTELENLGTNVIIRKIEVSGYTYFLINECLECTTLKRFKVYTASGELAGYFGRNEAVSSPKLFEIKSLNGILGDKLLYEIVNPNNCNENLEGTYYIYHGQFLNYTDENSNRIFVNCDNQYFATKTLSGDPFPDWTDEAELVEITNEEEE